MSTRATYLLAASNWSDHSVCMYIHQNGYLKGAAHYFWLMHLNKNEQSGYAGQFFRAVENAEFTKSHVTHGDTAYRYTLKADGLLTAWNREIGGSEWRVVYQDAWYEFVNKYCADAEELYFFKVSPYSKEGVVMTINEVAACINQTKDRVKRLLKSRHAGNGESELSRVNYLQEQLDQILKSHIN